MKLLFRYSYIPRSLPTGSPEAGLAVNRAWVPCWFRPGRFIPGIKFKKYCQFLSVSFIAAVVLKFDVEVEGDVGAVELVALVVGALKFFLYLNG